MICHLLHLGDNELAVPEYVLVISHLLHHGDNVHDPELDLGPNLYDAPVNGDELLRRHTETDIIIERYRG